MWYELKAHYLACSQLGALNVLQFIWIRVLNRLLNTLFGSGTGKNGSYNLGQLKIKQIHHPLFFRYRSSDPGVFSQIFIIDEYSPLNHLEQVNVILDCGANVGYSAVYLLSKFPNAHLIAIEPDHNNYEILKLNLAPYGDRVTTICAGIWSHSTQLKVCRGEFGDGREWATTVRECAADEEPDVEAIDISSILQFYGYRQIDILKIDIEGSEVAVFSHNYESWIHQVQTFAIELHGQQCEEVFYKALKTDKYHFIYSGELTIAQSYQPVIQTV